MGATQTEHGRDRTPHTTTVVAVLLAVAAVVAAAWVATFGWTTPSLSSGSGAPASEPRLVRASHTDATSPHEDVVITRCSNAVFEGAAAWGRVRNGSSSSAEYGIRVSFETSSGDVLAEGAVTVDRLGPGQSAEWQASAFVAEGTATRCRIVGVERLSS